MEAGQKKKYGLGAGVSAPILLLGVRLGVAWGGLIC